MDSIWINQSAAAQTFQLLRPSNTGRCGSSGRPPTWIYRCFVKGCLQLWPAMLAGCNASVYMTGTSYKFMDWWCITEVPLLTRILISHHVIYFSQEVSSHVVKCFLRAEEFVIVITTRQRFSYRWKTSYWSKKVKQLVQHHLLLCVSGVTDYQPGWLLVVILSTFFTDCSLSACYQSTPKHSTTGEVLKQSQIKVQSEPVQTSWSEGVKNLCDNNVCLTH